MSEKPAQLRPSMQWDEYLKDEVYALPSPFNITVYLRDNGRFCVDHKDSTAEFPTLLAAQHHAESIIKEATRCLHGDLYAKFEHANKVGKLATAIAYSLSPSSRFDFDRDIDNAQNLLTNNEFKRNVDGILLGAHFDITADNLITALDEQAAALQAGDSPSIARFDAKKVLNTLKGYLSRSKSK